MSVNFLLLTNVSSPIWQRSIGAYQIADHCRKFDISCQIIDFTDLFKVEELENLLNLCIDGDSLAIGVSTTFYANKNSKGKFISADRRTKQSLPDNITSLLVNFKKKYPKLKIIAGGANSYQLEDHDLFDTVFHGYSDQAVVDYLLSLKGLASKKIFPKKKNTTIIDGKTSDFDIKTLNHKWSEQDCILPGETLPIEISRGCIFKCTFCAYPLNGKKKLDYLRDPELIKEELIYNYEKFGVTNYYFTDDTFNDSTTKLEQLHKVITSLPFKIKFVTYLRLDLLYAHKEQINLLKEMGLGSAFFGIETLNHSSGKIIGKGMKPEIIKKFLLELYYNHWEEEIPITCSFIVGLPGETIESVNSTREWCKTTPINDLWFPLYIGKHSYYKSEFDKNYDQYGYRLDQDDNWFTEDMNYHQALELSESFNSEGLYNDNTPSTWFLFALLSYGFTIDELKNTKLKDLHWPRILMRKYANFMKYKKKLLTEIQKLQC
jgi:radical SAM superfamily enzyme YgiQ (UPF0313 family)